MENEINVSPPPPFPLERRKGERMELFISRLVATFISNDYTFQRAQREIKKKNWNESKSLNYYVACRV